MVLFSLHFHRLAIRNVVLLARCLVDYQAYTVVSDIILAFIRLTVLLLVQFEICWVYFYDLFFLMEPNNQK